MPDVGQGAGESTRLVLGAGELTVAEVEGGLRVDELQSQREHAARATHRLLLLSEVRGNRRELDVERLDRVVALNELRVRVREVREERERTCWDMLAMAASAFSTWVWQSAS